MKLKKNIIMISLMTTTLLTFPVPCFGKVNQPLVKDDFQRIDIFHYAKAQAQTSTSGGYKLMGVKWTGSPVIVHLNAANVDKNLAAAAIADSGDAWDAATGAEIFDKVQEDSNAVYGVKDNINSIEFKPYAGSTNVIAITSIWLNKRTNTISEFDMLYNTYYKWGDADVESNPVMDIRNIATHEFGHAYGLSDIYSKAYSYVTMYGYSDYDDTSKRTLESPDIAGIRKIYGN